MTADQRPYGHPNPRKRRRLREWRFGESRKVKRREQRVDGDDWTYAPMLGRLTDSYHHRRFVGKGH